MEPYNVFVRRPASDALNQIRGSKRLAIDRFISYLAANPFEEGDFAEQDASGRFVYCKVIRDIAITYYPDHPVKELKVLEVVPTP